MATHTFASAALQLLELGYSPIPVLAGECPVQDWKNRSSTTAEDIAQWISSYPEADIAILTKGLAALEVDVPHPAWRGAIERGLSTLLPQQGLVYSNTEQGFSMLFATGVVADGFSTCRFKLPTGELSQVRVASKCGFTAVGRLGSVDDGLLKTRREDLPAVEMNQLRGWAGQFVQSITKEGISKLPTGTAESRPFILVDNRPPVFATAGPELLRRGFQPIPVNGKRPVTKKWEEAPMHPDQIAFWACEFAELNTGLRTEDLVAVDLDIYHYEVADAVEKAFVARFGPGLKRLGQAPKRLLLYGAKTPGLKITSPVYRTMDGFEHRVEILGIGQQFVAYGIHPDSLRPYQWVGEGPLDIERWQLNVLDRDEVAQWVRSDLTRILAVKGFTPKEGGSTASHSGAPLDPDDPFDRVKQRHDDVSLVDLAWMLEHLDADRCDDRDDWRNAIFAVHHQFHETEQEEEAFDLVDAWSQKSVKYTAGCVRPIWDRAKEQRMGLATIGTLKAWLGDAWKGYKRTAVSTASTSALTAWKDRIMTAGTVDALKQIAADAKQSDLQAVDRSSLVTAIQDRWKRITEHPPARAEIAALLAPPPPPEERPATVNLTSFLSMGIAIPQLDPSGFPHTKETKLGTILKPSLDNMRCLMDNYGITAHYDVIRKKAVIHIPGLASCPDKADTVALEFIKSLAAVNDMPSQRADSLAVAIANGNPRNVVADFIQMLPWDGIDRLAQLQNTLTVREGFPVAVRDLMVRKWLISAVAACLKPEGFYSKGVLVLQGALSLGKSPWFMRLLPESHRHEYILTGALLDPDSKDSVKTAVSHWITELGEVDATMRKADIARLKAFLSNPADKLRLPYDRTDSEFQRRTVFAASVNPEEFLQDETGNLRWWVLPVVRIDYKHTLDMQQLWAQVATLYESGERWWLEQAEEQDLDQWNTGHVVKSAIQDLLKASADEGAPPEMWRRLAAGEVLIELGFKTPTNAHSRDCGRALRSLYGEPAMSKGLARWLVPPIAMHGSGQRRHEGFLASAFDD